MYVSCGARTKSTVGSAVEPLALGAVKPTARDRHSCATRGRAVRGADPGDGRSEDSGLRTEYTRSAQA